MLLGYGKGLLGYTFTVANMTRQDVKVQLRHAFGALNKEAELIKPFETKFFSFKGGKTSLCLSKIMVSTKQAGEWVKPEKATIKVVTNEQFKDLIDIDVVGDIVAQALRWWGVNMCRDRDFILIIDPESEKINAITNI